MRVFPTLWLFLVLTSSRQKNQRSVDILFMLVDDGGFELNTYGNNITRTPHITPFAVQ